MVGGCAARMALDPLTGDTGGPLSENELATDVLRYELDLEVFPDKQSIKGNGLTVLRALKPLSVTEIQLDDRFAVHQVLVDGDAASFKRNRGIITVSLPVRAESGDVLEIAVRYSGKPHVARLAPWDGGFVWSRTETGQPWIATTVQGEGCDLWWPCKDHYLDRPDRMDLRVTVPSDLAVALNGVLMSVKTEHDDRRTFFWRISVPISDYNVSLNVGPFTRIETSYKSVNGSVVPIEFWALPEHEKASRQMIEEDLRNQLKWFESVLGPYPWGNEKLGFVETPHLGMEHQTLIAYGNEFQRDPHGFDWLLQHELAHEWFGNLMTHARLNDAWLHEGFGAYMQPAYSRYRDGEAAYLHKMYDMYLGMENCTAVVKEGNPTSDEAFTGDIYGKGAWTLHTLRWLIGDEPFWRATRRLLYGTPSPWKLPYPIQPVFRSTDDFVKIVSEEAGRDVAWLFDAYLREADLPVLISERNEKTLTLRWEVPGGRSFPMPVPVSVDGEIKTIEMKGNKGTLDVTAGVHVIIDPAMNVLRRLPIIGPCEKGET
jgi:aminopeptidase N